MPCALQSSDSLMHTWRAAYSKKICFLWIWGSASLAFFNKPICKRIHKSPKFVENVFLKQLYSVSTKHKNVVISKMILMKPDVFMTPISSTNYLSQKENYMIKP